MKSMLFGLLFSAAILLACADEDAKKTENKEEGIKVYKRLIPADVLRGEFFKNILLKFGDMWTI